MVYIPGTQDKKEIALQTRKGNDIINSQLFEISPAEMAIMKGTERFRPFVTFRTFPDPIYNCHGLTFASRRTGIDNSKIIRRIIGEDEYTLISNIDYVLPGDIVIYVDEVGDIEHSGIVISKPFGIAKQPWVVSKWGSYKEAIHLLDDCPYEYRSVEFYRIDSDVDKPS